jgi:CubicO group peptidase (beta-lactamase class C family)
MKESGLEQIIRSLCYLTPVVGEDVAWSLEERMRHYGVSAVSMAVIDQGELAVAAEFGVLERGGAAAVTPESLFQAASMSKPVAALALMRAVEQGRFDLDRSVNDYLRSWRIPENDLTRTRPVTLRHILSHTSGLTVWGFGGYAAGAPLPTLPQLLSGQPPANSPPVYVDTLPGTLERYSGGGTTIAQLALEESYGEPFDVILAREVLGPLGMELSTFAQPLPTDRARNAVSGHDWNGELIQGHWHTFPEQAAAGLWTTAAEYARCLMSLQRAYGGQTGEVISPASAAAMAVVPPGGKVFGLGPKIIGNGRARRFQHGGSNVGYKCGSNAFLDGSRGAVVFTNSDNGTGLAEEIFMAISRVYDWPDYRRAPRIKAELSERRLDAYAGTYDLDPGAAFPALEIDREGRTLHYSMGMLPRRPIFAETDTRFFSPESLFDMRFTLNPAGRATIVEVLDGDRVVLRATRAD